jgi:tetratricopeptide (TPR) repeat protein
VAFAIVTDPPEVKAKLQAQLAETPDNEPALFRLLDILARQQNRDDMRKLLARALEASPDNPNINTMMGVFLREQGELPKAIPHFEKALRSPAAIDRTASEYLLTLTDAYAVDKMRIIGTNLMSRFPDSEDVADRTIRFYEVAQEFKDGLALAETTAAAHPDWLRIQYRQATILLQLGKHEDAERIYQRLLGRTPFDFDVCCGFGRIRLAEGKLEEAKRFFQRGLELYPDGPPLLTGLADIYLKQGKIEEAVTALRKALRLAPFDFVIHSALIRVLYGADRQAETDAACREAIRLVPWYSTAYYKLADSLTKQGDRGRALRFLAQGEACAYQATDAKFARALALNTLQRYEDALTALDSIAPQASTNDQGFIVLRAYALAALNRNQELLQKSPVWTEQFPTNYHFIRCWGAAAVAEKDPVAMRQCIAAAEKNGWLTRPPPKEEPLFKEAILYNLATLALTLKDPVEEVFAYATLQKYPMQDAYVNYCHGMLAKNGGKPREALDLFKEAVRLNPTLVASWCEGGILTGQLEGPAASLAWYTRATNSLPDDSVIQSNIGFAHLLLDNTEAACKHLSAAIAKDDRNAIAWYNLALAFAAHGDDEKATRAYTQAFNLGYRAPSNLHAQLNKLKALHATPPSRQSPSPAPTN